MRLSAYEVDAIVETFGKFVPSAKVYLFGSRADDSQRGGDIDLFVLNGEPLELSVQRKIKIALYDKIGEQRIDLVTDTTTESPFVQLILPSAVQLR